jgi:hypothetical protein
VRCAVVLLRYGVLHPAQLIFISTCGYEIVTVFGEDVAQFGANTTRSPSNKNKICGLSRTREKQAEGKMIDGAMRRAWKGQNWRRSTVCIETMDERKVIRSMLISSRMK